MDMPRMVAFDSDLFGTLETSTALITDEGLHPQTFVLHLRDVEDGGRAGHDLDVVRCCRRAIVGSRANGVADGRVLGSRASSGQLDVGALGVGVLGCSRAASGAGALDLGVGHPDADGGRLFIVHPSQPHGATERRAHQIDDLGLLLLCFYNLLFDDSAFDGIASAIGLGCPSLRIYLFFF